MFSISSSDQTIFDPILHCSNRRYQKLDLLTGFHFTVNSEFLKKAAVNILRTMIEKYNDIVLIIKIFLATMDENV